MLKIDIALVLLCALASCACRARQVRPEELVGRWMAVPAATSSMPNGFFQSHPDTVVEFREDGSFSAREVPARLLGPGEPLEEALTVSGHWSLETRDREQVVSLRLSELHGERISVLTGLHIYRRGARFVLYFFPEDPDDLAFEFEKTPDSSETSDVEGEHELYGRFMEEVFERPEEDASFLRSHDLVVTVRVGGEFDPETQVSIYREGSEVRAEVVRTPGPPVYEQISRLQSKREDVGYGEVRASVTVKHREVSSRRCPRLEALLASFPGIEISSEVEPTLYAPSVTYQIWMSEGSEGAYYQMTGPSRQSDGVSYWGSKEPIHEELYEWVLKLISLVGGERLGKPCG